MSRQSFTSDRVSPTEVPFRQASKARGLVEEPGLCKKSPAKPQSFRTVVPRIEIVIVSHGALDLLRACLRSVKRHGLPPEKMLVHLVDNATPGDLVDIVRREFPWVRIWPLKNNIGFSGANNVALRSTTAPWVLLLNPDTELRPGVLEHMLKVATGEPGLGIAGCRLERRDGSFDHASKRRFPTPLGALMHFVSFRGRGTNDHRSGQYRAVDIGETEKGEPDAVSGAFMLVRREVLQRVGLLDAGYFMYGEDLDWCKRTKNAGWRVVYDGRVTVLHVKGGAVGQRRPLKQNRAFHQAMGRFYRRFDAGSNPLLDVAVYFGIEAKLVASVTANLLAPLFANPERAVMPAPPLGGGAETSD